MIYAILGLVLLIIFLLVAVRVGVNREKTDLAPQSPMIHKSGIYSIVRRSPREQIANYKPSAQTLAKYLDEQTVDCRGKALDATLRQELVAQWAASLEASITEIENGDRESIEFYVYEYETADPVCKELINEHSFVTREQIFKYPKIIPPFHLGCPCRLKRYKGDEDLRNDQTSSLRCLFKGSELPTLPDWKKILA